MIFASTDLAARIERAECRLLSDCATAIGRRRPDSGVVVLPIAGGVATAYREFSPLNKLAGLGFEGEVDEAALEEVETAFAERGAPVQVELSILAEPSIGALLTRRGYVLQGFENVLGRDPAAPLARRPGEAIDVSESGDDELETWMDVVVSGFLAPDTQGVASHEEFSREAMERVLRDCVEADGIARYLARRAGAPAGGASLRMFEGVAQMAGAATLPDHRRRGVQSALLAARLQAARSAGCEVATVTTLPGCKSHENVQRQGFELLYTRAILVRPGPAT